MGRGEVKFWGGDGLFEFIGWFSGRVCGKSGWEYLVGSLYLRGWVFN